MAHQKRKPNLYRYIRRPLFRDNIPVTNITYPLLQATEVFDRAEQFDIIHFHLNRVSDYPALPLAVPHEDKTVFTAHFPYPTSNNQPDRHAVLQKYHFLNFTSISDSQREGGGNLHWLATVYNGIDVTPYQFHPQPKDYYAWIGRFDPIKGPREAILAAKQAGVKIVLAGKTDSPNPVEQDYYEKEIKPLVDGTQVQTIGEIDDAAKNDFLGNAIALLNPIQWNEPFGLTMVEAMACGTPVIAFKNGAAPEIVEDGKTGFLVSDVNEMTGRVNQVKQLSRQACREQVEEKFTADVMTENYVKVYRKMLNQADI